MARLFAWACVQRILNKYLNKCISKDLRCSPTCSTNCPPELRGHVDRDTKKKMVLYIERGIGKDAGFICIKINFACHLFVAVAPLEFYFSDFRRHSNSALFSFFFCSNCKPCPVAKPTFLCGADNRTYSSLCRLDYHNCIHSTSIRIACKGFCPCKGESISKS